MKADPASRHGRRIDEAQRAQQELARQTAHSAFRQRYHFMAPGGWINDPNGCIWYGGQYHLFYQHNPFAAVWGEMHWGHAVSRDLVHWEHLPVALAPSEPYDDHPRGGVFSGSTFEADGALMAAYTATSFRGDQHVQAQCLARSLDGGLRFEKYANNPVIAEPPEGISADFRDPRVLRQGDKWYMVLGASLGAGAWHGGEGCALLYESDDLANWRYRDIIARSKGELGTMWECVDLYPLDGRWVLSFSPMFLGDSKAVCLTGDMDFQSARFTWDVRSELDWGGEYYAPQSMADGQGRTVLMAWQNGWDWMPWWKDFGPVSAEGWCGSMALPRRVSLDKGRMVSEPAEELAALRRDERSTGWLEVDEEAREVPCANPDAFELGMTIDFKNTSARAVHLDLRAGGDRRSRLTVDLAGKRLIFDRTRADGGHTGGIRSCELPLEGDALDLRVFSDTVSIEAFAAGGLCCMSNLIYPTHPDQRCRISAEGGTARLNITTWRMADA